MDLSPQLTSFFKRYGFIILPGLGYIQRKYRPPFFDKANHKIEPPEEKLHFHFDRGLKDKKFAEYLSSSGSISSELAEARVREYVAEDIWSHLNSYRRYRLDQLGDLVKEENGYVRFEPMVNDELAHSNYGLPILKYEEVEQEKRKSRLPILPGAGCLPYLVWVLIPLLIATAWLGIDYLYKKSNDRVSEALVYGWRGEEQEEDQDAVNTRDEENALEVGKDGASAEGAEDIASGVADESGHAISPDGKDSVKDASSGGALNSSGSENDKSTTDDGTASGGSSGTVSKSGGTTTLPSKPRKEGGIIYYAVDCSEFIIIGDVFGRRSNARSFCAEMRRQGYPARIVGRDHLGRYMVGILNFQEANSARGRLASIKNYIAPEAFVMAR